MSVLDADAADVRWYERAGGGTRRHVIPPATSMTLCGLVPLRGRPWKETDYALANRCGKCERTLNALLGAAAMDDGDETP